MDFPFSMPFIHRLDFTRAALNPRNPLLAERLNADPTSRRAIAFVDSGLLSADPDLLEKVTAYFQRCECDIPELTGVHIVPGGEVCKNDTAILQRILRLIAEAGIDRRSYVIVIGGGAVLDAVGYAAALVHRGVRLVRLPTTSLAQADSGVGVKNGINAFGKKNFLGTFAVPWAVIHDELFLDHLSDRDWRCGLAEAIKVALIRDHDLFQQIEGNLPRLAARETTIANPIFRRSALLHLRHITEGGDPFETQIARPLDFGHWSAHQLEQMTDFQLRHGEAVAIGIAIDVTYAAALGYMTSDQAGRAISTLAALGFQLRHPALGQVETLIKGLAAFQEHLGGPLTLTFPNGIGDKLDVHEIDHAALRDAIQQVHRAPGRSSSSR